MNAKEHKYGAVLGALVNLPLHLRHFFDFILLIALYRSKWAKDNGGLVRLLTGMSSTGEVHGDGLTLAAEVQLGLTGHGTQISLPSDIPGGDDCSWNLRVFFLLFSLDWLAHGDFGPFAASVSAKRPCFKCEWTADCPCAYSSARAAAKVTHSAACRGRTPRTHAHVMRVVHEMRLWRGSAAELAAKKTDTGIFATHFVSEHLLADVVRDAVVDIMHIFLCGVSRYLLSFLTDILIPLEFSWVQLQAAARSHRYKRGVKPPVPEPRVKSSGPKKSRATKMNAADTMHFTLSRSLPPGGYVCMCA